MHHHSSRAFSLVELSIVLVILGLITGGILAGQSLIRSAELRSVITEQSNFQQAIEIFKDKYQDLPGDMSDATDYWGSMTNCVTTSPSGSGTQTCDGNGNALIGNALGASRTGERYGFWQHLANAGLIEGQYDGIAGAGRHDDTNPGENAPGSRLSSEAVWDVGLGTLSTSIFHFTDTESHGWLRIGGDTVNWNNGAILTVKEAWSIDSKMDDGHATKGRVWVVRWNDCTPATSGTDYQDYDLSVSGEQCGLVFRDVF